MATLILVLNCGSSSVKYQLIDMDTETPVASGLVEKIALPDGIITHKCGGQSFTQTCPIPDHTAALDLVKAMFDTQGPSLTDTVAVAHRIVQGGWLFSAPTLVTPDVIAQLDSISLLAPLHNPGAIAGIRAAQHSLPNVPHVTVFDTAFFADLPTEASTYAIDRAVAAKYHIRRYGFHGTSHRYVSRTVAKVLDRPNASLNQITCHLGNGASIAAVQGGRAIETSMGLTPLQGLVMGTRSGDIDPAIFRYLAAAGDMDAEAVDNLLNKQSGLAGLADGSADFRDLLAKIDAGDPAATLAFDVYIHRLTFYIGGYMALLGRTDAITFTAGVGENVPAVRAATINRLSGFGITLDREANTSPSRDARIISAEGSAVTVLVVPTNEEWSIARQTLKLLG